MIRKISKLCAIVCILGFSVMVVGTHESGQLFPWLQIYVFVSSATILLSAFFGRLSIRSLVIIVSVFAVSLRLFIFEWPASMIGQDPFGYAVGVIRIVQTGNLIELKETFPVYGILSSFHILNSIVAIVSGFGGRNVVVAIPILVGIMFPLTAIAITLRHTDSSMAISLSAVIAAVAATGVYFSYWTMSQIIAVLLWCSIVIVLMRILSTNRKRDYLVLFVLAIMLMFAHKISVLIFAASVIAALVIRYIKIGRIILQKEARTDRLPQPNQIALLITLSVVLLLVQWVIMTGFIRTVIIGKIIKLLSGGVSGITQASMTYDAARLNSGIVNILLDAGNFLSLLAITAIASLTLWIRDRTWTVCLLLGASLVSGTMVGLSLIGAGVIAPMRSTIFAVPIFASVISISFKQRLESNSKQQLIAIFTIIFAVLAFQAGSMALAPDFPNQPHFSLTNEEKHAKEFMIEHSSEPIAMDHFYAGLQIGIDEPSTVKKLDQKSVNPSRVRRINEALLNATLTNSSYKKILLRKMSVSIFANGEYRLTWNPIQALTNDYSYNRILDTDQTAGFVNGSSSG